MNEFFDSVQFLKNGEHVMEQWHKLNNRFQNFISKYSELSPSDTISKLNLTKNQMQYDNFNSEFQ